MSIVLRIFALAVAVRWAYALAIFVAMGNAGLMSGDSFGYLTNAENLAAKLAAGTVQGWQWLGHDLTIMPLFPWLLTLNVLCFGALAPLATILMQGAIDAGTCLAVYGLARTIAPRFAAPAGVAASLNPTQIVLSGLLYTDTLFVFFAALSLYAAARWYRAPSWPWALAVAAALGLAAVTRVAIVLWMPCLAVFLLAALAVERRLRRDHFVQVAAAGTIVLLCLAPVVARNVLQYGAWALTPQGGAHLALWVVPLVQEAKDGTPWATGTKIAEAQMRQRFPEPHGNPFVESARYVESGRAALAQHGFAAVAKAWVTGAALNLGAPAAIIAPPVLQLPRIGFYDTQGANIGEKIANYVFRSAGSYYTWILLLGLGGVVMFRLLQAVGFIALLREPDALAILLMLTLWIGYVLAISGPIASPKYRLPMEPALSLLTGVGAASVLARMRRRRGS